MERRTRREEGLEAVQPGREDVVTLLRRPAVQGLLVLAAIGQAVAVGVGASVTAQLEGPEYALALDPVVVTPQLVGGEVGDAWLAHAVQRESKRLAAEHRQRGYPVTDGLASQIASAAFAHGIKPEVAFGLIRAESSFRNTATSPVGATGLTQLMPRTAAWMQPGVTRAQLRDPQTNLNIGFQYLRYLIDKYDGDERLALLAYNRGPGTVDRALRAGRNPDNGYADFVYGKKNHGHRLFTNR